MRIRSVAASAEPFALARPYTIAFRTVSSVQIGVVRIATDDGLVGFGTASPEAHVTGETDAMCAEALTPDALGWLVGRDARALPALVRELERRAPTTPAARAAVDIALHDLLAKRLGVPLVEMLGRAHDALPTSITIGIKPTGEAVEEAAEHVGRGFRVLKVKLGKSLEEDLERVRALRERFGARVGIRVDANQGWSPKDAAAFFERARGLDVELVEQPTAARDVAAMRALPEEARRKIAADESLLVERDALDLVAPPRACGIFNIKLMKCGGIAEALRMIAVARAHGMKIMLGCMIESSVAITAAAHLSPLVDTADLDGNLLLDADPYVGATVVAGRIVLPEGPGLGVRPRA